jgi:hypothetical protein
MKKKILTFFVLVVTVTMAAYNVFLNTDGDASLPDMVLANVQALTENTQASGTYLGCFSDISAEYYPGWAHSSEYLTHVTYCVGCSPILGRSWKNPGICRAE